jgi:NTP pyrophosphatase (non-canonical NTP hydrolase)
MSERSSDYLRVWFSQVDLVERAVISVAEEMFQDDLQEALADEREALAQPRPEVRAFALLMEAELAKHDDRPGWKNEDIDGLAECLDEEVRELTVARLANADAETIGQEAADVANFAMMIADVVGALPAAASPAPEGEKL